MCYEKHLWSIRLQHKAFKGLQDDIAVHRCGQRVVLVRIHYSTIQRSGCYLFTNLTQCAARIISGSCSASALTKARREYAAAAAGSPTLISLIARFNMTHSPSWASPASSASCWARLKLDAATAKSPAAPLHDPFRHHVRATRVGSLYRAHASRAWSRCS